MSVSFYAESSGRVRVKVYIHEDEVRRMEFIGSIPVMASAVVRCGRTWRRWVLETSDDAFVLPGVLVALDDDRYVIDTWKRETGQVLELRAGPFVLCTDA